MTTCVTSRKIAGSIPNGIIGIFHWFDSSGLTVVLGSTQRLTEMCFMDLSWGGGGGGVGGRRGVGLTTVVFYGGGYI
jgi:hypothetical protein